MKERHFYTNKCTLFSMCSSDDLFVCLFKISDRGGGVPLRITDRLFSYTYSTAPTPVMDNSRNAPLVRPIIWLSASQPPSSEGRRRSRRKYLGKLINLVKLGTGAV